MKNIYKDINFNQMLDMERFEVIGDFNGQIKRRVQKMLALGSIKRASKFIKKTRNLSRQFA